MTTLVKIKVEHVACETGKVLVQHSSPGHLYQALLLSAGEETQFYVAGDSRVAAREASAADIEDMR